MIHNGDLRFEDCEALKRLIKKISESVPNSSRAKIQKCQCMGYQNEYFLKGNYQWKVAENMRVQFKNYFHRRNFMEFIFLKNSNYYSSRSEFVAAVFLLSADKLL